MTETTYTVTVIDGKEREMITGTNYTLQGAIHTVDIAFRLMADDPGPLKVTIERHREDE